MVYHAKVNNTQEYGRLIIASLFVPTLCRNIPLPAGSLSDALAYILLCPLVVFSFPLVVEDIVVCISVRIRVEASDYRMLKVSFRTVVVQLRAVVLYPHQELLVCEKLHHVCFLQLSVLHEICLIPDEHVLFQSGICVHRVWEIPNRHVI